MSDGTQPDGESGGDGTRDGEPADDVTGDNHPTDAEPVDDAVEESSDGESATTQPVDHDPTDDVTADRDGTDGTASESGKTGARRVDDWDAESEHRDTPTTRVRLFNANEGDLLFDSAARTTRDTAEGIDDARPDDAGREEGNPEDDYGPADVRRDYRDDVRLFADPDRGVVTLYCNVNRVAPEQVLARVRVEPGPLSAVLGRARAAVDRTLAAREWSVVAAADQPVFDVLGTVRDAAGPRDDAGEGGEERDGGDGARDDAEDTAAADALDRALGAITPDGDDAVTLAELVAGSRTTVVTPGEPAAARLLPVVCRRWPADTTLSVVGAQSNARRTDVESAGVDAEGDSTASRAGRPELVLRPDVAADSVRLAADTRRELARRRQRRLHSVAESLPDSTSVEFGRNGEEGGLTGTSEMSDGGVSEPAANRADGTDAGEPSGVGSSTSGVENSLGRTVRRHLPAVLVTAVVGWIATGVLSGPLAAATAVVAGLVVATGVAVVRSRRTHLH